jgi:hypothetical protein
MISVKDRLLENIKKQGRGNFFFPADFIGIAKNDMIKDSLSRLQKEGTILRLGHGIYYYPKVDKDLGIMYPSLEDIAYAIARRDQVTITPTAEKAMNALGLTTQVPINAVFLSNGPSKEIKIGKNKIIFKTASNRRVAAGKSDIGIVIRALEGVGEQHLSQDLKNIIFSQLNQYTGKDILKAAKKSPRWIADMLFEYVKFHHDTVAKPLGTKKKTNN